MKFILDSTPCLLHLLLLAELFVCSSSRPSPNVICQTLRPMMHQVERLTQLSKKLYDLTDGDNLVDSLGVGNRLDTLPHIQQSADQLRSAEMKESLSQLYVQAESFKLHVDWLKTAKENVSLPSESVKSAKSALEQLTTLTNTSLQQINQEVPQTPSSLSLPVVSTAFDALTYSIEISERLKIFCHWSKATLRSLQRKSHCPKR